MPTKSNLYWTTDGVYFTYNDWSDHWEPIKPSTSGLYTDCWSNVNDLRIKKVIFNEPATIVFWKDGTKTVVKCNPNDIFDPEKGIAMCFVKKIYGNKGRYNNAFKPWVDDYYAESALKFYNNGVDIVDELKSAVKKVNNWLNGKED